MADITLDLSFEFDVLGVRIGATNTEQGGRLEALGVTAVTNQQQPWLRLRCDEDLDTTSLAPSAQAPWRIVQPLTGPFLVDIDGNPIPANNGVTQNEYNVQIEAAIGGNLAEDTYDITFSGSDTSGNDDNTAGGDLTIDTTAILIGTIEFFHSATPAANDEGVEVGTRNHYSGATPHDLVVFELGVPTDLHKLDGLLVGAGTADPLNIPAYSEATHTWNLDGTGYGTSHRAIIAGTVAGPPIAYFGVYDISVDAWLTIGDGAVPSALTGEAGDKHVKMAAATTQLAIEGNTLVIGFRPNDLLTLLSLTSGSEYPLNITVYLADEAGNVTPATISALPV
jgi:hypothetical protein